MNTDISDFVLFFELLNLVSSKNGDRGCEEKTIYINSYSKAAFWFIKAQLYLKNKLGSSYCPWHGKNPVVKMCSWWELHLRFICKESVKILSVMLLLCRINWFNLFSSICYVIWCDLHISRIYKDFNNILNKCMNNKSEFIIKTFKHKCFTR